MSDKLSVEVLGSSLGLSDGIIMLAKDYLTKYSIVTGRRVSLPMITAALYYSLVNSIPTDLDMRYFISMVNTYYSKDVVNYRSVKKLCKQFAKVFGGKWRPTIRDVAVVVGRKLKLRDDEIDEIVKMAEDLKAKMPEITNKVLVAYVVRVKTRYSLQKITRTMNIPSQSVSNLSSNIKKNRVDIREVQTTPMPEVRQ